MRKLLNIKQTDKKYETEVIKSESEMGKLLGKIKLIICIKLTKVNRLGYSLRRNNLLEM